MNSTRFRLLATLILLLGCLHVLVQSAPFEDAYVTYRYAEHLAHGQGLTYNVGERVEGVTSLAWALILGALARIGVPLEGASVWISSACGLLLVFVAMQLARALLRVERHSGWLLAVALGIVAQGTWAYYSASGMETAAFALLVTFAVWCFAVQFRGATELAAAALALAAMTRPEGVGYAAAIIASRVIIGQGRRSARAALVFSGIYLPFFIARRAYFGFWLPNTYYAKVAPSKALLLSGLSHIGDYFFAHGFAIAFVAAIGLAARNRARTEWTSVLAVLAAATANACFVGTDTFAYYRTFLPAIPCGVIAVTGLCRTAQSRFQQPAISITGKACLAAWILYVFSCQYLPFYRTPRGTHLSMWQRVVNVRAINDDYFIVGEWLRTHLAADTLIATNAAGIVPYISGLHTLDMLGLNDAHIAHRHMALGVGAAGHEKHDAHYVLSRKPDVILLGLPMLTRRRLRPSEITTWCSQWFAFLPGDRSLYMDSNFRHDYAPVIVDIGSRSLVLFVRQETAGHLFETSR